ncbi:MAG: restriction endonuclease [Pseudomonadota bacterium]
MNQYALSTALAMLDRFEAEAALMPQDAERLVASILRACGHEVTESGFVGGDNGVDCYFDATLEGRRMRIGVEIKNVRRQVQKETVYQAHAIAEQGRFDRAWVVSRSGFSQSAIQHADALAGVVDLLSPADLRSWVAKYASDKARETGSVAIIRAAMRELAKQIAMDPNELRVTEWRDLERVLREVFEGIGFDTHLTRPGKDGGFDLELSAQTPEGRKTYLVEVKHWSEQKPGAAHLTKLVRVSIERAVEGALLLSTSGFTSTIYSGLLEVGPPVRLGAGEKVIALCKTYYRLSTGYWLEESLLEALFSGTTLPQASALIV